MDSRWATTPWMAEPGARPPEVHQVRRGRPAGPVAEPVRTRATAILARRFAATRARVSAAIRTASTAYATPTRRCAGKNTRSAVTAAKDCGATTRPDAASATQRTRAMSARLQTRTAAFAMAPIDATSANVNAGQRIRARRASLSASRAARRLTSATSQAASSPFVATCRPFTYTRSTSVAAVA